MKSLYAILCLLLLLLFSTASSAQEIKKKKGKVKLFYPSGKLHSVGKVKNYHRNGTWKYFDEEGNLVQVANFVMDTIDGPFTEFYANGALSSEGQYKKNNKSGLWKGYDQYGNKISEENFRHGIQDGVQKFWYPGGRLRDSLVFEKGKFVYVQSWYQGGGTKKIETYQDGLAEGRWLYYPESYTDTFPETSDQYHLGKKEGWHYYWRGSVLLEAYHYSNGLPDGTFTRYQIDGNPLLVQTYSKGYAHGTSTYFKDGKKLKVENYSWGKLDSVQTDYDRDEVVVKRSWYTIGNPDSSYSYFKNGKISTRRVYGPGIGFSQYTEWDSAGVLLLKGMMLGENREGEWTNYYTNGKVLATMHYANGVLLGLYTKFYPNGKKMIQYTFLEVGTNTQPDVWNQQGKMLKMGTKEYDEIVEGNRPTEFMSPSEVIRKILDQRKRAMFDTLELPPGNIGGAPSLDFDSDTSVFTFCELMPEFPGGRDSMLSFIRKNSVYSGDAHAKSGTVYVSYVVEIDGKVSNVKVLKGIPGAPDLNNEAVRLVSMFPPQYPARMNGRVVRCQSTLPIRFEPYH